MKTLVLKRHGKVEVFTENTLSDAGVAQSIKFGEELRGLFKSQNTLVLSSPIERAQTTTRLILGAVGLNQDEFSVEQALSESSKYDDIMQGVGNHLTDDLEVVLCVSHGPVIWDEVDSVMERRGIRPETREPEGYLYNADAWGNFGFNLQRG